MILKEQEKTINNINNLIGIFRKSSGSIRPHFILTGESGSGKSYAIRTIAEKNNIKYVEINAAQLTKEGTAGNSLSKALSPIQQNGDKPTICFVDEFDKLFISGNSNSSLAHEITNGVQNEFLKVLESETSSVYGDYGKYIQISVRKVLFIFAGAFNGEEDISVDRLRDFGIKTEFIGRVGVVFNLEKISLESMIAILNNSKLLDQYLDIFPEIKRQNTITAIEEAIINSHENNTLGARLIDSFIHRYFINKGVLNKEDESKVSFNKKYNIM